MTLPSITWDCAPPWFPPLFVVEEGFSTVVVPEFVLLSGLLSTLVKLPLSPLTTLTPVFGSTSLILLLKSNIKPYARIARDIAIKIFA